MAVSITQTANPAGQNAASNIATYSTVAIGDAAPNRIIVVTVGTELTSSTPSACTIDYGSGDTAMTAGTGANGGILYSQLYWLAVPTGTTATIKVTYSSTNPTSTQNHIAVYKILGGTFSTTGSDSSLDMDASDPLTTGSTTIAAGGGMIAVAAGGTDTTGKTWANLTEDVDADAGTFRFTTATSVTAGTATRTCTGGTNGEDGAMSWIIFTSNASPTVALSTPTDGATSQSTTPALIFTGTDAESNDIRYNVQVATTNFIAGTLGNTGSSGAENAWDHDIDYTKFTYSGATGLVTGIVSVYLNAVAGAGNNKMVVGIYKDSDNSLVASSAEITGLVTGWQNASLSSTFTLTNGSVYWLAVHSPSGNTGRVESGSAGQHAWKTVTYDGTLASTKPSPDGTSAEQSSIYLTFTTSLTLDKVSGTDAGFSGSPDNSDPFASAQAVTYTVQSALSNSTTYYWRVRGIDPSGSNAYGAWPTAFSFTTASAGTNVTVNAGIPNATFTTQSPTVTTVKNKTVSPSVQSSVFSTQAPTITATKNVTVTPGVQSIVASQPSIGITVGDGATPAVQSAVFSAVSPTVSAQKNSTVSAGIQSAVFSTQNPTIKINDTVSANVQTATFTALNPTVDATSGVVDATVNAGVQTGVFSQQTVTVSAVKNATPSFSVQTGLFSLPTPTISAQKNPTVSVAVQTASFSQQSIGLTVGDGTTPAVQSATFSAISPAVTTTKNITVSPNVQTGIFNAISPTVRIGKTISPSVQTATFSNISPDIITGDTEVTTGVNTGLFTALSPTVSTVRNCTVYPQCLTIGQQALIYNERLRPLYRIARDIWLTL